MVTSVTPEINQASWTQRYPSDKTEQRIRSFAYREGGFHISQPREVARLWQTVTSTSQPYLPAQSDRVITKTELTGTGKDFLCRTLITQEKSQQLINVASLNYKVSVQHKIAQAKRQPTEWGTFLPAIHLTGQYLEYIKNSRVQEGTASASVEK